jgi:hypothetical protein
MALSLDGVAVANDITDQNPVTGTLTCSSSGNIIVVCVLSNFDVAVDSVTGGGVTFTRHAQQTGTRIEMWSGYSSGTFNAAITVNRSGSSFICVHAFGINGAPSSNWFDTNAAVPTTGATDPLSISTDTADTFIIGTYRMASTANPTAGTGFTVIAGDTGSNHYMLTEYKIVSSTQSSLSVPIGTGSGDANGGIVSAVVSAPSAPILPMYQFVPNKLLRL